tara:strand:+ start:14166 stop:19481 length:5316 start_codon:yes stop_codon:yes gene_type:complete
LIETPLDTLTLRRETFVKSLYDGVGVSEAADEYLEAHGVVTKADLYYSKPSLEPLLLYLAKAEGDTDFFQLGPESGQMGDPEETQHINTLFQGQLQYSPEFANTFDMSQPANTNPHLQHAYGEVEHTFTDGKVRKVPRYIAHNFLYYTPREELGGISQAEYDNRRLANMAKHFKTKPNEANVFNQGIFHELSNQANEPTIQHHTHNNIHGDESVLHMLENNFIDGDVPELRDVLLGVSHLRSDRRKKLYDEILERGGIDKGRADDLDHNGNHSIALDAMGKVRVPLGRMITSSYKKILPLYRALIRPERFSADNQIGVHENLPAEETLKPMALYNAMHDHELIRYHVGVLKHLGKLEPYKDQIDELADKIYASKQSSSIEGAQYRAEEIFSRMFDLPKYNAKKKRFSVDRLDTLAPKKYDWHNSINKNNLSIKGVAAAFHYDLDRNGYFPLGGNPSGVEFDKRYALHPENIQDMLGRAERHRKSYYEDRELRNNSLFFTHPHVHDNHMEDFMEGDNKGLSHFWTQMFNGVGGEGLEQNNALLVLAHIFEHPFSEEEQSEYMEKYSAADEVLKNLNRMNLPEKKRDLERIMETGDSTAKANAEEKLKEIEKQIDEYRHNKSLKDYYETKLLEQRNLLIDYNHPDDPHNYIHPKGEVTNSKDESKGYGGAHNALAFAGQQQQHIVRRPVFDPVAVHQHKKAQEKGLPSTHPISSRFIKVPRNAPASALKFGYRDTMDPQNKAEADAADAIRSENIKSYALSLGTPAHMGITASGHQLKQVGTNFSRHPKHTVTRLIAHLKDMLAPLGLPKLSQREPDDPTYSGKLKTPNKDVIRNRGKTDAIHDTHLHSNTDIGHAGEVEHHDRNIHEKERQSILRGLIGGEANSPLYPQEEHALHFDDARMEHHGHKLITDILRRDPVNNPISIGDVETNSKIIDDTTDYLQRNLDAYDRLKQQKNEIESKLDTRNPEHIRNFEERDRLQGMLQDITPFIEEFDDQMDARGKAQKLLNRSPRYNIKDLFEKINDIIDGGKGLPHDELSEELQKYIRGRVDGFRKTREKKLQRTIEADKKALTQIAADERNRWIDSQGLSFGNPNNIPRYLGNLAVYMKAMERRLHSEDTGGIYETLQSHMGHDPESGEKREETILTPITPQSDMNGSGSFVYYNHSSNEGKKFGFEADIKPVYDSHGKLVRFEQVEPYDFLSKTLTRPMYKQVGHEYEARWGPSMDSKMPYADESAIEMFGGGRRMVRKQEDATILLASLSNPDIMLKKDGEYPILQPMHRIFKLDDLEHLRGFSGDWIVSAMPEGPRAFVEKKDDKITVRGDFDLDKETKENFEKISKKNFVVDVVLADKEYNVIDIVEYDDSDVHDMPLQERIKILRGTMESTENVLLPAAHNLRLTDDVGLEVIVKDLLKEHKRLVLRDANSTYMKGENRHPKWVLYDEGQDVNLMVLDRKGTSSFTYRLGTGPITHEDSLGDRAVEYEGDTYMDVGTSFQSKDEYEVGDIVTVNVDSISVTESVDGADIYTVNSNEIKGEAEGEGVSSVETLSMFTKSEPMMWPHEIDRDGNRIVIKMAAGDVSYRASAIDGEWYMFNPKAENGWLIRLAESQRPFWSPVAGVMLKADLSLYDDESKAEVHESKNDGKPLIPPKKTKNTNFWESEVDDAIEHKKKVKRLLAKSLTLASSMLKSGVGAVGDSSTGAMGLGIDYATPIESPSGPTSLVGSKTMPDHDARDVERDNKERAEDKKMAHRKPVDDGEAGRLSIDKDKAAFVPY